MKMSSRSRLIAAIQAGCLLLASTPATAQKIPFLDSFIAFHSALFGAYGDEAESASAALERMSASLDAWEQSQIADEATLIKGGAALAERARFYAEHGRLEEATAAIAAAVESEPNSVTFLVLQGLLFDALNRRAEAATAFAHAHRADPADPIVAYLAASRRSADPAETLQPILATLTAAAQRAPTGRAPALLLRIELIPDSASSAPAFAPAAYAEGFELFASRRFREALARFGSALRADPLVREAVTGNSRAKAGISALREKHSADAIEHLEAAVAELQDSSEAHRLLGLAYRAGGRLQDSIREFTAAMRLAPEDERPRIMLGSALALAGNLREAERVLRQTIDEMPKSGEARWALAVVYDLQNRGLDALATLEEAAALPIVAGRAALHWRIAQLAYRHQDHERVAAELARRAEHLPNDPAAHKALGFAYLRLARSDEALTELLMTAILGGTDAETLNAMGRIHLDADRLDAAEQVLRRAATLDPTNAQTLYVLGNTLMRLGRTAEGTQHLKEYAQRRSSMLEDDRRRFEDPAPTPK
jgi:tetratricopeptide (TPR) repeat protein